MSERPLADGLALRFAANGAGAVFHVYDRHTLDRLPRRYVVGAGDWIDGEWRYDADNRYDLWVLGPNGFHRHFAGQQGEPVPAVAWTIGDTGLALTVPHGNPGLRLIRLTPGGGASEEALAPGRHLWSLYHVLGWYDITLTHAAQPAWRRRLAGRHDRPGRASVSDPFVENMS